jgi:phosphate transport system substrate-binding protein
MRVTVGVSGTGGGFKKFCRGETDIERLAARSSKRRWKACKASGVEYIELPVAFDALTVVVNPGNTWLEEITVAELKKMWEPERRARSPVEPGQSGLARRRMKLFGAGADSGTFDYFTEAVMGKAKASAATSPPARTTTCWCRAWPASQRDRLFRLRLLRREHRQAARRADQGQR